MLASATASAVLPCSSIAYHMTTTPVEWLTPPPPRLALSRYASRSLLALVLCLLLLSCHLPLTAGMSTARRSELRSAVRTMFLHGYHSYLRYAFPHDELKPLSRTWTDSLAQLGNSNRPVSASYHGVALTLIDSLSTLAVLNERTEFNAAIDRVRRHVHFGQSVRVNVFEVNIRLLGGLLSGHVLAADKRLDLTDGYDGVLLERARELGDRLMPAFNTPTGMPYAWVNLLTGVEAGETTEQCSAGVGTLLLEFGLLSYLTGDDSYFHAADRALSQLYSLRSPLQLVGNTVDITTSRWLNHNAGIGAGVDSYFEYMYKANVLLGNSRYWSMFNTSYTAAVTHLKHGSWYIEADMNTGQPQHLQFQSLQSFWPGLQSLLGHFDMAADTFTAFFSLWTRYHSLPERFVLNAQQLHNSERYYPLRPELMESAYYLYRVSRHPRYLVAGEFMYHSLYNVSRVGGGYAGVKDVESRLLEDHMSSFFLAETCKYLYLLFDDDNWLHRYEQTRQAEVGKGKRKGRLPVVGGSDGEDVIDYVFTTEGHLFPLLTGMHQRYGDSGTAVSSSSDASVSDASAASCPVLAHIRPPHHGTWVDAVVKHHSSLNQPTSIAEQQQCPPAPNLPKPSQPFPQPGTSLASQPLFNLAGMSFPHLQLRTTPPPLPPSSTAQINMDYQVRVADGAFYVHKQSTGERVEVRNLGTRAIEVMWLLGDEVEMRVVTSRGVFGYEVRVTGCGDEQGEQEQEWRIEAAGAYFSPSMPPGVQYIAPTMLQDMFAQTPSGAAINFGSIPGLASLFQSNSLPASPEAPTPSLPHPFAGGMPIVQMDTPADVPTEPLDVPLTPLVRSSTPMGCAAADEICVDPDSTEALYYWYSGSVVLLDRGECSFLDKAVLAEEEDAEAVLIVNQPPPSEGETVDSGEMLSPLFAMGFSGSDTEVSIPAFMISWHDGQRLHQCLDRQDEAIERLLHDQPPAAEENSTTDPLLLVDETQLTHSELVDDDLFVLEDQCLAVDDGGVHVSLHRYEDVTTAGVRAGGADGDVRVANLRVMGQLSHLFVELSSGWTVEVLENVGENRNKQYQLRIH